MEYTLEKRRRIIEAVDTIRETCVEAEECAKCPFNKKINDALTCLITHDAPFNWISTSSETEWKALV